MHRPSRTPRWYYAAVWTALLSVLMTVIAPVISQTQATAERGTAALFGSGHGQHYAQASVRDSGSDAADPAQELKYVEPGSLEDAGSKHHDGYGSGACGYCFFYAHSPTVPTASSPMEFAGQGSGLKIQETVETPVHLPGHHRPQQPRAPPQSLVVRNS